MQHHCQHRILARFVIDDPDAEHGFTLHLLELACRIETSTHKYGLGSGQVLVKQMPRCRLRGLLAGLGFGGSFEATI